MLPPLGLDLVVRFDLHARAVETLPDRDVEPRVDLAVVAVTVAPDAEDRHGAPFFLKCLPNWSSCFLSTFGVSGASSFQWLDLV